MKILAIDTTASPVSAAVLRDGSLCGEFFLNVKTTHSQTLMPVVSSLLKNAGTEIEDIDVFAVNAGPGSFTGVRIGVASVKGMTLPLGKPCACVSTLESMAYNFSDTDSIICAVMDARCSQVYNALFEKKNGVIKRLSDDRALSIEDLAEDLKQYSNKLVLVGDGAELCYNSYREQFSNIFLASENSRYQNASGVAFAAADKERITAGELLPTYLRLPQAERELKKRMGKK